MFALYLVASVFNAALTAVFLVLVLSSIEWRVTAAMVALGGAIYYANRAVARNVSAWAGRGKQAAASAEFEIVQQLLVGARRSASQELERSGLVDSVSRGLAIGNPGL